MLNLLRTTATVAVATIASFAAMPERAAAQTYQIDCAILLCLSGGWPSSVPCARARAEFIRRITPWPVEPPLQIWRCPMGASFVAEPVTTPFDRLWDVLLDDEALLQSYPAAPLSNAETTTVAQPAVLRRERGGAAMPLPLPDGFSMQLVEDYANEEGSSDIDISSPEFNFVRSIRVYMVRGWQQVSNGDSNDCFRSSSVRLGSYGMQGDYHWTTNSMAAVPPAYGLPAGWGSHCPSIGMRSVFVDWRDYAGNYGWERVDY